VNLALRNLFSKKLDLVLEDNSFTPVRFWADWMDLTLR